MDSVFSFGAAHLMLMLLPVALPKDRNAPLPALVLSARTVYIDNQSGYSQVADRAYDELMKWGRFEVVDSPAKADLVLRFTADTTPVRVGSTSTYDSKPVFGSQTKADIKELRSRIEEQVREARRVPRLKNRLTRRNSKGDA